MENILIITGHGGYATGMKSTLSFIAGEREDVYAVNFSEGQTEMDLVRTYNDIISNHTDANIVFVCDLLGGTPFRASASLACENDQYEVVCGCTIGSLIEAIFIKDSIGPGILADFLVEKSIDSLTRFTVPTNVPKEIESYDDGI